MIPQRQDEVELKVCSKCSIEKPITRFDPSYDKRCKNPGRRSDCKDCRNKALRNRYPKHKEKLCAYAKKYRKDNPDKIHHQNLMARFGISYKEYQDLFSQQGNVCAICKKPNETKKRFPVDHCHSTGKVRAILCHHCNAGLGHYFDNPSLLVEASEYIKKHNGNNKPD